MLPNIVPRMRIIENVAVPARNPTEKVCDAFVELDIAVFVVSALKTISSSIASKY